VTFILEDAKVIREVLHPVLISPSSSVISFPGVLGGIDILHRTTSVPNIPLGRDRYGVNARCHAILNYTALINLSRSIAIIRLDNDLGFP
jgi:hypothetical protein